MASRCEFPASESSGGRACRWPRRYVPLIRLQAGRLESAGRPRTVGRRQTAANARCKHHASGISITLMRESINATASALAEWLVPCFLRLPIAALSRTGRSFWEAGGETGRAYEELEATVLGAGGTVVRFGQFCGPGTYYTPTTAWTPVAKGATVPVGAGKRIEVRDGAGRAATSSARRCGRDQGLPGRSGVTRVACREQPRQPSTKTRRALRGWMLVSCTSALRPAGVALHVAPPRSREPPRDQSCGCRLGRWRSIDSMLSGGGSLFRTERMIR